MASASLLGCECLLSGTGFLTDLLTSLIELNRVMSGFTECLIGFSRLQSV